MAAAIDVTKRKDVEKLVATAKDTFGGVDVISNSAGLMPLSPMESLRAAGWDQMVDVNVKGTL